MLFPKINISMTVAAIFLGILLATQMRATEEIQKQSGNSSRRYRTMINVLEQARHKQNSLSEQVAKLRKELEDYKAGVAETGQTKELKNKIDQVKILTGEITVQGPGLYMSLDDRQATTTQVFSGDIKDIINILRYAGAEVISVNGQRVVENTAVHEAGRNLLINKVPVNRREGIPYEFYAIGDSANMDSFLKVTYGLIADLQSNGVQVTINRVDRVEIPAYKGGF